MIYDTLAHLARYSSVHPLFAATFAFLAGSDLQRHAAGKIDLGSGVVATVNEYLPGCIEEKFIECHDRFIDVQMVVCGSELLGVCSRENCRVVEPYTTEKDMAKLEGEIDLVRLYPGNFAILFPWDGHMPGVRDGRCGGVGSSEWVKKVVVKVPITPD